MSASVRPLPDSFCPPAAEGRAAAEQRTGRCSGCVRIWSRLSPAYKRDVNPRRGRSDRRPLFQPVSKQLKQLKDADMASFYQRFSGKINTGSSFPVPPEASRLLGQVEQPAEPQRPGLLHPYSRRCEDEDEDVSRCSFINAHQ